MSAVVLANAAWFTGFPIVDPEVSEVLRSLPLVLKNGYLVFVLCYLLSKQQQSQNSFKLIFIMAFI